jgi:hypothetical protein
VRPKQEKVPARLVVDEGMSSFSSNVDATKSFEDKLRRATRVHCIPVTKVIEIGSGCGIDTVVLAQVFEKVITYDPVPHEAFSINTAEYNNIDYHRKAYVFSKHYLNPTVFYCDLPWKHYENKELIKTIKTVAIQSSVFIKIPLLSDLFSGETIFKTASYKVVLIKPRFYDRPIAISADLGGSLLTNYPYFDKNLKPSGNHPTVSSGRKIGIAKILTQKISEGVKGIYDLYGSARTWKIRDEIYLRTGKWIDVFVHRDFYDDWTKGRIIHFHDPKDIDRYRSIKNYLASGGVGKVVSSIPDNSHIIAVNLYPAISSSFMSISYISEFIKRGCSFNLLCHVFRGHIGQIGESMWFREKDHIKQWPDQIDLVPYYHDNNDFLWKKSCEKGLVWSSYPILSGMFYNFTFGLGSSQHTAKYDKTDSVLHMMPIPQGKVPSNLFRALVSWRNAVPKKTGLVYLKSVVKNLQYQGYLRTGSFYDKLLRDVSLSMAKDPEIRWLSKAYSDKYQTVLNNTVNLIFFSNDLSREVSNLATTVAVNSRLKRNVFTDPKYGVMLMIKDGVAENPIIAALILIGLVVVVGGITYYVGPIFPKIVALAVGGTLTIAKLALLLKGDLNLVKIICEKYPTFAGNDDFDMLKFLRSNRNRFWKNVRKDTSYYPVDEEFDLEQKDSSGRYSLKDPLIYLGKNILFYTFTCLLEEGLFNVPVVGNIIPAGVGLFESISTGSPYHALGHAVLMALRMFFPGLALIAHLFWNLWPIILDTFKMIHQVAFTNAKEGLSERRAKWEQGNFSDYTDDRVLTIPYNAAYYSTVPGAIPNKEALAPEIDEYGENGTPRLIIKKDRRQILDGPNSDKRSYLIGLHRMAYKEASEKRSTSCPIYIHMAPMTVGCSVPKCGATSMSSLNNRIYKKKVSSTDEMNTKWMNLYKKYTRVIPSITYVALTDDELIDSCNDNLQKKAYRKHFRDKEDGHIPEIKFEEGVPTFDKLNEVQQKGQEELKSRLIAYHGVKRQEVAKHVKPFADSLKKYFSPEDPKQLFIGEYYFFAIGVGASPEQLGKFRLASEEILTRHKKALCLIDCGDDFIAYYLYAGRFKGKLINKKYMTNVTMGMAAHTGDISSFDYNECYSVHKTTAEWWMEMGFDPAKAKLILSYFREPLVSIVTINGHRYKFKLNRKKLNLDNPYTNMDSGSAVTSIFNSCNLGAAFFYVWKEAGEVVHDMNWEETVGWKLKFGNFYHEKMPGKYNLTAGEFVKGHMFPTQAGGYVWIPGAGPLSKSGKTLTPLSSIFKTRASGEDLLRIPFLKYQYCLGKQYFRERNLPIYRAYVKRGRKAYKILTEEYGLSTHNLEAQMNNFFAKNIKDKLHKPNFDYLGTYSEYRSLEDMIRQEKLYYDVCTDEVLDFYCAIYGIGEDAILRIEKDIENADSPRVFVRPAWLSIREAAY